jgi:hypothetical protein
MWHFVARQSVAAQHISAQAKYALRMSCRGHKMSHVNTLQHIAAMAFWLYIIGDNVRN